MVEQIKKEIKKNTTINEPCWDNSLVIDKKRGFQAHSISDKRVEVYKSGYINQVRVPQLQNCLSLYDFV